MDNSNLSEEQHNLLREVLDLVTTAHRFVEKRQALQAKQALEDAMFRLIKLVRAL